jgi:transcriptional regulator with XRE-family HTH domain
MRVSRPHIGHYNNLRDPSNISPEEMTAAREFARRLEQFRTAKGWNQSELARQATKYLPTPVRGQKQGKEISRDQISHWHRAGNGGSLPRPETLAALAKALGVSPGDLMPEVQVPSSASVSHASPWQMKAVDDDHVSLQVNKIVTLVAANKIIELLKQDSKNR